MKINRSFTKEETLVQVYDTRSGGKSKLPSLISKWKGKVISMYTAFRVRFFTSNSGFIFNYIT